MFEISEYYNGQVIKTWTVNVLTSSFWGGSFVFRNLDTGRKVRIKKRNCTWRRLSYYQSDCDAYSQEQELSDIYIPPALNSHNANIYAMPYGGRLPAVSHQWQQDELWRMAYCEMLQPSDSGLRYFQLLSRLR